MKKFIVFMLILFTANIAQSQWWPDVRVTYDNCDSWTSVRRCVSACGDTVHIAWYDDSLEHPTIHYARSLDAGLNWDPEQLLTDGTFYDEEPSIASEDPMVHIVWYRYESSSSPDMEIYYMRSTDGGVTWEAEIPLTNYGGTKRCPSVAISGNYVHVVWFDEALGDWDVFYMRSMDSGTTWEEKVRLTNQFDISAYSTIAVSGSVLHIVWHDWRDGNKEIYYKRSSDNGNSWGEDTRLTFSDGDSRLPEIAVSGSFVNIVWQDSRDGSTEIYSICSIDGGLTWSPEARLTNESSPSEMVSIAVAGSESHVVWQDLRSGLMQIYYKNGHNYGTDWDEDERLITTVYNAYWPSLAISGEWLHAVWYDERDGNDEIYCKNRYIENPIGISDETLVEEGMAMSIYPNPADQQLAVGQMDSWTVGRLEVRLSIFNLYGRKIKEFENISSFPFMIDISDLRNGMYLLQVKSEDGKSSTVKFLKIAE